MLRIRHNHDELESHRARNFVPKLTQTSVQQVIYFKWYCKRPNLWSKHLLPGKEDILTTEHLLPLPYALELLVGSGSASI
jgi:hypothetical protein